LNSCRNVALVEVMKVNNAVPTEYNVIDIYGNPGKSCTSNPGYGVYDYTGQRAVRKTTVVYPESEWNPPSWVVTNIPGDIDQWIPITPPVPLVLFITEIADPPVGQLDPFIELYSPNYKDYVIPYDLYLIRFVDDQPVPSSVYLNLKGYKIQNDGMLVLCINQSTFEWNGKCDYGLGSDSIANIGGRFEYGLAKDVVIENGKIQKMAIVDLYGRPGPNTLKDYYFSGGRTTRITRVAPKSVFERIDWSITIDGYDPHNWNPDATGSPTFSPTPELDKNTPAPTKPPVPSPPSKGKGKGKGKKTGRRRVRVRE